MGLAAQPAPALSTNGLTMPDDFPVAAYEAVHGKMTPFSGVNNEVYGQFAGAWNAISYRYRAFADCDELFTASISTHGAAPNAIERYRQERDLFGFFSNGFSTFEAFFYAVFAAGAFLQPAVFLIATSADQQRITASRTIEAYARAVPKDAIVGRLQQIINDTAYRELRDIRNVLTHRSAPGRTIHVAFGSEAAPNQWKLSNIVLDQNTTATRRAHAARLLAAALEAFREFSEAHLSSTVGSP